MLLFKWICLLLPFQIASSLPTPAPITTDIALRDDITDLEARQLPMLLNIALVIAKVVELIIDIVDQLEDASAAQAKFTRDVVSELCAEYPGKNVLVYHDQDSDASYLENVAHQHYELEVLDLGLFDFTKGYEILVFDYGLFYRAGDGGYQNWCTGGEFDINGREITYYDF